MMIKQVLAYISRPRFSMISALGIAVASHLVATDRWWWALGVITVAVALSGLLELATEAKRDA